MIPNILVVDDENSVRITIVEFLKDAGYNVYSARDAYEAVLLMKEMTFSVVITDLLMPKIDGMDLVKDIYNKYPETKIIIMTGYPTDDTYIKAKNDYKVFDYLSKPVLKDDIRTVVNSALQS